MSFSISIGGSAAKELKSVAKPDRTRIVAAIDRLAEIPHLGAALKGVIIGQLLISIVGFGALFDLHSANFLMEHFWTVLIVLFGLAFSISEALAALERRYSYFAAKR